MSREAHQEHSNKVVRITIIGGLVLNGVVFGATAAALVRDRGELPLWFIPIVVIGTLVLEAILAAYIFACWQSQLKQPAPVDTLTLATLGLIGAVLVCTSSVHQFYPFRLSLPQRLEGTPLGLIPPSPILRYNFVLTAVALGTAIILAILYLGGYPRAAVTGISALAILLLIPNDDCGNAFNRAWIKILGASPVMFAPASTALLVGACGLCQLGRRTATAVLVVICLVTLLIGIGHMTNVLW